MQSMCQIFLNDMQCATLAHNHELACRMVQASLLMYGARVSSSAPPVVTRHWPSGLFAIVLGAQAMTASLAAGTFVARRRAVQLAAQVRMRGICMQQPLMTRALLCAVVMRHF